MIENSERKVRAAVKKILQPILASEGFTGKYSDFRRSEDGLLQLLSVQQDKLGTGFVLEFGLHALGPLETAWGTVVAESELDEAYVPPGSRARLGPQYADFFRCKKFDTESWDRLEASITEMFLQINAWLRDGKVGTNVKPFTS